MPSFTSESVCAGHPDKVCDQISDASLDEVLRQDPDGHVAVETVATFNRLILAGEVTTTAKVDFAKVARQELKRLGYTNPAWNFSDQSPIEVYIHEQSPQIAGGVGQEGAGDQGMMFGYACRETPRLMPAPIELAHALTKAIDDARESGQLPWLRPDGKAQITVEYKNGRPHAISHVVAAVAHDEAIGLTEVRKSIEADIIAPTLEAQGFNLNGTKVTVNGAGAWHIPGPASDAGLTGRKIVVDTYGGYARVGGGAFSGKDPSKVDRSGAYAARYVAKNIVAAGLAEQCEVGLAYYIGAKQPIWTQIETFGTAKTGDQELQKYTAKLLDLSVKGILESLQLKRPIYHPTAAYGHFGPKDYPWEQIVSV